MYLLFILFDDIIFECAFENYTVSQTTLEQVFLNFARSQLDPDELRRRMREGVSFRQRWL
ncbi:unnamed protein product, partial [Rotaria socialis]